MGKKSNRKKQGRIVSETFRQEHKNHYPPSYLLILATTILFLWGYFLFDKTFISGKTILIPTVFGGLLGTILMFFFWRNFKYGVFVIIFYGLAVGASVSYFSIVATNYYLKSDTTEKRILEIISTGNRSGRKSRCKTPYAIIEFNDIKNEITFPCEYEKTISLYKKTVLTLAEGYLGFPVIIDKSLIK